MSMMEAAQILWDSMANSGVDSLEVRMEVNSKGPKVRPARGKQNHPLLAQSIREMHFEGHSRVIDSVETLVEYLVDDWLIGNSSVIDMVRWIPDGPLDNYDPVFTIVKVEFDLRTYSMKAKAQVPVLVMESKEDSIVIEPPKIKQLLHGVST